MVTGSSPSEGKTTAAVNLASSLALAGYRVILIEADLRRPSLREALEMDDDTGSGVVGVLIENASLEDSLVPTPTFGDNLRVLLADSDSGWIADLFSIPAAREMLDDARALADFVIVDSPPLIDVVDALPLARRCDDLVIVVRLGRTRLDRLSHLAELLAENDIVPAGFAVVGTKPPGKAEYSYYLAGSDAGKQGKRRLRRPGRKRQPDVPDPIESNRQLARGTAKGVKRRSSKSPQDTGKSR
jgi:capsular exopolysaccharide synthesis family protein